MLNGGTLKITLDLAIQFIYRDSAIWEGVSLLYISAADALKAPSFEVTIKELMKANPDAMWFESKDSSYMVLDAKQPPETLGSNLQHYFWAEDISSKWQQVCDALERHSGRVPIKQAVTAINHSCSILIVEDEPLINKMMEHYLSKFGTVTATNNYHQAIANYMVQRTDIVFLDIHYHQGGMDGFDILRNLLIADNNAFIVMVSGDGTLATKLQALALGAKGFIVKPFNTSHFSHYITKLTNNNMCL